MRTDMNSIESLISNSGLYLFEEEPDGATVAEDEVDIFYQVTYKRDGSCNNELDWCKCHAVCFSYLSKLSTDTFMLMRSYVLSKSFSPTVC